MADLAGSTPYASRARSPDTVGVAERNEVLLSYATYGTGEPTVLLMPTWAIMRSHFWKAQIPYLARYFKVVTFDGRGSGGSSRPTGAAAYTDEEYAADTIAVMDAAGVDKAALVGLSCAASWSVHLAAGHPDRVLGIFAISPACGFPIPDSDRDAYPWDERLPTSAGWASYNRYNWLEGDYDAFLRFFFQKMFSEPHSTKQFEDAVAWGHEIEPSTLVDTIAARLGCDGTTCSPIEPLCALIRCPVTVIHGTGDRVRTHAIGQRLAELTDGNLILVDGGGHGLPAREPVFVNREIKRFVDALHRPHIRSTWTRARSRDKRALYLSSPIGLGHASRDLAIAGELRGLHPDLQIDWLAEHPVSQVLEERGETVHPASGALASESAHFEDESADHDLHAFQTIRRMDDIMVNNFMVFSDLVERQHYDLVIADEAWDVDYFLHENPELKRSPYAWLTDFVGWLPMPDGGEAEVALTADYNAEMIEHRARFRRLRDRSIFVGNPDDIVEGCFGPDLPEIRGWVRDNFDFSGYVSGFDPSTLGPRDKLRSRLGYVDGERVCLVTVGGSGVGEALLRRVIDAVPLARSLVPDLHFVVVTGPRIDPLSLPQRPGLTVRGYLPRLYEHLAACDLAVVQGGLTTCMELAASQRPFLYVPLRHHFEQNYHVRKRLEQYGAGRCLDYAEAADPDALSAAIAEELAAVTSYRPVETDGASRAATLLSDLL